jgi:D-threo-aldose 1-dehydrogenase
VKVALSRLSLGAAPLGGLYASVSDEDAIATVHAALLGGVIYIDTAPFYGYGLSERRVGAALAQLPSGVVRNDIVLSTKVGRIVDPDSPRHPRDVFVGEEHGTAHFDFSRDGVRRSLDDSLERLGVDHVDIALVHDPDNHMDQAIEEAMPALVELRDEGVVQAVGAGMNTVAPLQRFVHETDVDCILVAGRYTLLDRSAAEALLPACEEGQITVIAGGVFNSGILASGNTYDYGAPSPDIVDKVKVLQAVCAEHGIPLAAAAIQFVLGHPAVGTALLGARHANEVTENLALATLPIPTEFWEAIA